MPESMTVMFEERLSQFVQERLRHPDTRVVNLLNGSLGAWQRYFSFLRIIRERYLRATVPYVEGVQAHMQGLQSPASGDGQPTVRSLTADEILEAQGLGVMAAAIHLDIESFFVFANILLDRVASTCRYYFWKRADWNHRQLTERFTKICEQREFSLPDSELLLIPSKLHAMIVSYRNARVEHVEDPRLLFGTMWGLDKKARIAPTLLYPAIGEAETAQTPPGDIDEIMRVLELYLCSMLDFFDANAEGSILSLASGEKRLGPQ
jgi:hypothetical protein